MKVICVDASRGFQSKEIPPFNEGDILEAAQSPYHEMDYLILPEKRRGWDKKRFIPLSNINENLRFHKIEGSAVVLRKV